jgi:superfamily II DNA or RNA helicase
MPDIRVVYYDEVHIRVLCEEPSVAQELSDHYTFDVPGARFSPKFKHKQWDGKIRLYNIHNALLYAGLLVSLYKFASTRGYTLSLDEHISDRFRNLPKLSVDDVATFLDTLNLMSDGKPITSHDHQISGIRRVINNERCLLLSPTGSGKSLLIYAIIRYYQEMMEEAGKKVLVVVPTINLVYQLNGDFADYASASDWVAGDNCHSIYEGQDRRTDKPVVISTWQSIYKMPRKFFDQFGAVVVDECHQMKSDSIRGILEKLHTCPIRVGLTGTLDGMKTNKLVVEGLTGKVHQVATTKDLQDAGILSDLDIDCVVLQYPDEERKIVKDMTYPQELEYLVFHEGRNNFIADLAIQSKGNTLVLFQFVEKHGKVLYELIQSKLGDSPRKVFYIHGGVDGEIRDDMRATVEQENNAIIVASYGTLSTGVNIKSLQNIVFASPAKGRIRVLQSIGRQLRIALNKGTAKLYDISDDLSWKKRQNFSLKHLLERVQIYTDQQFKYRIVPLKLPSRS